MRARLLVLTKCVLQSVALLGPVVFTVAANAQQVDSGITFQGRILKPDGRPLAGESVQFKMQLRSPGDEDCLLYEELQTLDMRTSSGAFSITMNSGRGSRLDSSGYTIDQVFANTGVFDFTSGACISGAQYAPKYADGRKLVVSFKDETMSLWEPMETQRINFVPLAIQAKQIGGFDVHSLVRVQEADGTLGNISPLSNASYTELLRLVGGTSNYYVRSSNSAGARVPVLNGSPMSPVAGSVWLDSSSGKLKFHDGSSSIDLGSGGGGSVAEVTAASGLETNPVAGITGSGSIGIAAGGVATGMLSNDAVTFAKMQNIATNKLLGRSTSSTGDVEEIALGSGLSLNAGILSSDVTGLPSCSGAGDLALYVGSAWTCVGASPENVASTIVRRDLAGHFAAGSATLTSSLILKDGDVVGSGQVTIAAPVGFSGYSLTLPTSAGSANQVLRTNGSGVLSWTTPASGTGDFKSDGSVAMTGNLRLGFSSITSDSTSPGQGISISAGVNGSRVTVGSTPPPNQSAQLWVKGSVVSSLGSSDTTNIDFSAGNVVTAGAACVGTNWALSNMMDGGSYTLVVQNATHSGACVFNHAGVSNWYFRPANAQPVSGHVIYTMLKVKDVVYVSWIDGFQ